MSKKLSAVTPPASKPSTKPETNEHGQTPLQAEIEAQAHQEVTDALATLATHGYHVPAYLRDAVQQFLKELGAGNRWRHQAEAIRAVLPTLLWQRRRGQESQIQNDLDLKKEQQRLVRKTSQKPLAGV